MPEVQAGLYRKYAMPDGDLLSLCHQISTEKNPAKIAKLIDKLIRRLAEEQDIIKATIARRLCKSTGGSSY
jgi:hypothetical protein